MLKFCLLVSDQQARVGSLRRRKDRTVMASAAACIGASIAFSSLAFADSTTDTLAAARAADARHDYATELALLRPLAAQGNADAIFGLAVMYANGRGVPRVDADALQLLRKAAELGSGEAQGNLGVMYRDGHGVSQNDVEAAIWSRKAAEQGYADGQFILAGQYLMGQGVPQDYVQACMWLTLAAAGGNKSAAPILDHLKGVMTASQVAEAQQRADKWRP